MIKKQEDIDEKIAEEILTVIYENIDATTAEDVERVLATIHENSTQRRSYHSGNGIYF